MHGFDNFHENLTYSLTFSLGGHRKYNLFASHLLKTSRAGGRSVGNNPGFSYLISRFVYICFLLAGLALRSFIGGKLIF